MTEYDFYSHIQSAADRYYYPSRREWTFSVMKCFRLQKEKTILVAFKFHDYTKNTEEIIWHSIYANTHNLHEEDLGRIKYFNFERKYFS